MDGNCVGTSRDLLKLDIHGIPCELQVIFNLLNEIPGGECLTSALTSDTFDYSLLRSLGSSPLHISHLRWEISSPRVTPMRSYPRARD